MNYDALIYESAFLILAISGFAMAVVLFKLTSVAGRKQGLWILPVLAAIAVLTAGGVHVYANYNLLPKLSVTMNTMSTSGVLFDAVKSAEVKANVVAIQKHLSGIKVLSFSLFLIASILLLLSTSIYLRWISQ